MVNEIKQIQLGNLLTVAMEMKSDGYRIAQICCAFVDEKYELSYSFAKEYELKTYRLIVDKDTEVPSITDMYYAAFLYENEMKELFGVNMQYIETDYKNKLYRIDAETPFIKEDK